MSKFFNTTDSSVVVDDDGHAVDGLGFYSGKETKQVKHLKEQKVLVPVKDSDEDSEDGDTDQVDAPKAKAAVEQTPKTKR
jgi:hypothetical protein